MAAKKQTPTPRERAQHEVDKARDIVAKLEDRLEKAKEGLERTEELLKEKKTAVRDITTELAYEREHADLLARHPLLGGEGAASTPVYVPTPDGPPVKGKVEDLANDKPAVREVVADEPDPVRKPFAAVPGAAPTGDESVTRVGGQPTGTVRTGEPKVSLAAVPVFDPTDDTPMTVDSGEDEAGAGPEAQADAPFEL